MFSNVIKVNFDVIIWEKHQMLQLLYKKHLGNQIIIPLLFHRGYKNEALWNMTFLLAWAGLKSQFVGS